jgi:predicted dehydrogenase
MSRNVAIVGCGLVGRKRASALAGARLVACADIDLARAEGLIGSIGSKGSTGSKGSGDRAVATTDWRAAISRPDVDVVVVATTNESLADVSRFAIDAGKHVLVEKPAARNLAELDAVIVAAAGSDSLVRVGFNHRYHGALMKARELTQSGALGEMMFVRGRYGHGGRVGYEKEWRADPARSGGGELLDQGVHLIDLSRLFLGEFTSVDGFAGTFFWPMAVDDNAFLTLRTAGGQTAFLHASCSEWKNLFSLEIYGKVGKLHVNGLGGSYGVESLVHYRMLPQMGPPEATTWEFAGPDRSWEIEFEEFLEDISLRRQPDADLAAARAALVVVEAIYARSGYDFARR